MAKGKTFLSKLIRRNSGVAAVEFALVLPVLILLIAGMMDLGHAFYLKQIITNASREGARYGVLYHTGADGNRIAPESLTDSIRNWVLLAPPNGQCDLNDILAGDVPDATAVVTTDTFSSGEVGKVLTVTVTCDKTWWILNKFVPSMNNYITLSARTVMRVE
jgi:Flp pilus assembly protein TadG